MKNIHSGVIKYFLSLLSNNNVWNIKINSRWIKDVLLISEINRELIILINIVSFLIVYSKAYRLFLVKKLFLDVSSFLNFTILSFFKNKSLITYFCEKFNFKLPKLLKSYNIENFVKEKSKACNLPLCKAVLDVSSFFGLTILLFF